MNLLKCPLCKDFFKVPVLLPSCSHNFCYGCVPGNVAVEECPICGEGVRDEDTPVRNKILDDLVRIFRESIQVAAQSGDESTCSTLIESEEVSASSQDESMDVLNQVGKKNVPCPVCLSPIPSKDINNHLDGCLTTTEKKESRQCRLGNPASKDGAQLKEVNTSQDVASGNSSDVAQSSSIDTVTKKGRQSKFWTYEPVVKDVDLEDTTNDTAANLKPVSKTRVYVDESEEDKARDQTSRSRRGRSLREVLLTSDSDVVSVIDGKGNDQLVGFTSLRAKTRERTPEKETRSRPKERVDIKIKKGPVAKQNVVINDDISSDCLLQTTGEQARVRSLKRPLGTRAVDSQGRSSLRASPVVRRVADSDSSSSINSKTPNRGSSRVTSFEASNATAERKERDFNPTSPRSSSERQLKDSDSDHSKKKKRSSKFWTYDVVRPEEVQVSPSLVSLDIEGGKRSTRRAFSAGSDARDLDALSSPRSNGERRVKDQKLDGNSNRNANAAKKMGSSKYWDYEPVEKDTASSLTLVTDNSADYSDRGVTRSTRRSRSEIARSSITHRECNGLDLASTRRSNDGKLSCHQRQSDSKEKVQNTPVQTESRRPRISTSVPYNQRVSRNAEGDISKSDLDEGIGNKVCESSNGNEDKKVDKRQKSKSKFWEYVPVTQEAEISDLSVGSDVEAGKRPTRRSCSAAGFEATPRSDSREASSDLDSKSPRLSRKGRSKVLVRKKGGSTFWTYLPVVDQEVKLIRATVSGSEREKRASRRSCSAGDSHAMVSNTERTDLNLQSSRSSISLSEKNFVPETCDSQNAQKKSSKVDNKDTNMNKKRTSKFWTYEPVVPGAQNTEVVSDETFDSQNAQKKSSKVDNKDTNMNKKRTTKFWTYEPVVPGAQNTEVVSDLSDQEGGKRCSRRSCSAVSSDAFVSETNKSTRSKSEGRPRDSKCRPNARVSSGNKNTEMSEDLSDTGSMDKRKVSSGESLAVVGPTTSLSKRSGSDAKLRDRKRRFAAKRNSGKKDTKMSGDLLDNDREKRSSRRSSAVVGSSISESDIEMSRKSGNKAKLRDTKRRSAAKGSLGKKQTSVSDDTEMRLLKGPEEEISLKRICSVEKRSKSSVASLFSKSNVVLEPEEKIVGTESREHFDKSRPNTEKSTGLVSTSVESLLPQNSLFESAQKNPAPSTSMSSQVLSAAGTPSRKRNRSASSSPAPVNTLLARHKRQRTDRTGVRKKLNKFSGLQSSFFAQDSSSEDVYDFGFSEENIPESLGGAQQIVGLQVASSELAVKISSGLVSPKIVRPESKKDKTDLVSASISTPKQKKKTNSETLEQNSASFRSPFTSPTTASIASPKPITPLVAGIFCNSPAFGAAKFADDEDHVDGFGYVDDSSSEADSEDDLLGSISHRIDNFDEEDGDHPDINHNIPNKEMEKLWPALSKRPSDEPQPLASGSQALVRESPKKTPVKNLHLVPESPIIHRLGGRVFRKRTPGDQGPKPRHIEKAKKRL